MAILPMQMGRNKMSRVKKKNNKNSALKWNQRPETLATFFLF